MDRTRRKNEKTLFLEKRWRIWCFWRLRQSRRILTSTYRLTRIRTCIYISLAKSEVPICMSVHVKAYRLLFFRWRRTRKWRSFFSAHLCCKSQWKRIYIAVTRGNVRPKIAGWVMKDSKCVSLIRKRCSECPGDAHVYRGGPPGEWDGDVCKFYKGTSLQLHLGPPYALAKWLRKLIVSANVLLFPPGFSFSLSSSLPLRADVILIWVIQYKNRRGLPPNNSRLNPCIYWGVDLSPLHHLKPISFSHTSLTPSHGLIPKSRIISWFRSQEPLRLNETGGKLLGRKNWPKTPSTILNVVRTLYEQQWRMYVCLIAKADASPVIQKYHDEHTNLHHLHMPSTWLLIFINNWFWLYIYYSM